MNLSIIIPTTDGRNQTLNKTLKYYETLNCEILVVDGGKEKKKLLKSKKTRYFSMPNVNFEKRIKFALKKSNYQYVLNSQDDDFVNLSLVKRGIRLLDKKKDISWVGGNQIFFIKLFRSYFLKKIENPFKKNFNNKDFLSNDILKRSYFFLLHQPQLFACLFRKKHLIKSLNDFSKISNSEEIYEMPYSVLMSLTGKYYHYDDIWQFRDGNLNPNPANDYYGYYSRFVTYSPIEKYLRTNHIIKLKKLIYSKLKNKISNKDFNILFKETFVQRYKENKFSDNEELIFFQIKLLIKKNSEIVFFILKKTKNIFSFIFLKFQSLFFDSLKYTNSKKSWIKILKYLDAN